MPLNIVPPPTIVTNLALVRISLNAMLSGIVLVVGPQVTVDVFILGSAVVTTAFDGTLSTLRMVVHVFT